MSQKTIRRYKIPVKVALFSALFFLAVSIFVWASLVVYSFCGDCPNLFINKNNVESFYRVGMISTTITFGLFTIQFTIRSLQNAFSEKQSKIILQTTNLISDYMEYISSPSFIFVRFVCDYLVESFNLESVFKNFENIQPDFVSICLDLISNSSKDFGDELIDAASLHISASTKDGTQPAWFGGPNTKDNLYDYFMSRFIYASNWFDAASYQYVNENVDEEAFEEQILYDVRFVFLIDLIFSALKMTKNECKSISYQAIKKFKDKSDIIKKEKKEANDCDTKN